MNGSSVAAGFEGEFSIVTSSYAGNAVGAIRLVTGDFRCWHL
jgi:hypothetical protein